jgi:hypothetical protein
VSPVRGPFTLAERPDLIDGVRGSGLDGELSWPSFYDGSRAGRLYWGRHYTELAEYVVVFTDDNDDVRAVGHSAPMAWDGDPETLPTGWDAVLKAAFSLAGRPPAVSALSAVAHPDIRGTGMGYTIVTAMRENATRLAAERFVAPVRPSLKARHPLVPIERYIEWSRADGSHFDPWLRVHLRLGARILKVAPRSMIVEGRLADWTRWTGLAFPRSGDYVVPGALMPITVDVENDHGRYVEPNVWVEHQLGDPASTPVPDRGSP